MGSKYPHMRRHLQEETPIEGLWFCAEFNQSLVIDDKSFLRYLAINESGHYAFLLWPADGFWFIDLTVVDMTSVEIATSVMLDLGNQTNDKSIRFSIHSGTWFTVNKFAAHWWIRAAAKTSYALHHFMHNLPLHFKTAPISGGTEARSPDVRFNIIKNPYQQWISLPACAHNSQHHGYIIPADFQEGELTSSVDWLSCAFDIEIGSTTYIDDRRFPLLDKPEDIITNLSLVFWDAKGSISVAIYLYEIAVDDIQCDVSIHVTSEKQLLASFLLLLFFMRPFYLFTYNGYEFDHRWILGRLKTYNLFNELSNLTFLGKASDRAVDQAEMRIRNFEPGVQLTSRTVYIIPSDYQQNIDMMIYALRTRQYDPKKGFGLNAVCSKWGLGGKEDVAFDIIHLLYACLMHPTKTREEINETVTELLLLHQVSETWNQYAPLWTAQKEEAVAFGVPLVRKITEYCLQDARLVMLLSEKLNVRIKLMADAKMFKLPARLAHVTGVATMNLRVLQQTAFDENLRFHTYTTAELFEIGKIEENLDPVGGITLTMVPQTLETKRYAYLIDLVNSYPSHIQQMNASFETISWEVPPPEFWPYNIIQIPTRDQQPLLCYIFTSRVGMLPKLIHKLGTQRKQYKAELAKARANKQPEHIASQWNAAQEAVKTSLVSLYGMTNASHLRGSPFYSPTIAIITTVSSANTIYLTSQFLLNTRNLVPITGVTDSIMITAWDDPHPVLETEYRRLCETALELQVACNAYLCGLYGENTHIQYDAVRLAYPFHGISKKHYCFRELPIGAETPAVALARSVVIVKGYTDQNKKSSAFVREVGQIIRERCLDYKRYPDPITEEIVAQVLLNVKIEDTSFTMPYRQRSAPLHLAAQKMLYKYLAHKAQLSMTTGARYRIVEEARPPRRCSLGAVVAPWKKRELYTALVEGSDQHIELSQTTLLEKIGQLCEEYVGYIPIFLAEKIKDGASTLKLTPKEKAAIKERTKELLEPYYSPAMIKFFQDDTSNTMIDFLQAFVPSAVAKAASNMAFLNRCLFIYDVFCGAREIYVEHLSRAVLEAPINYEPLASIIKQDAPILEAARKKII